MKTFCIFILFVVMGFFSYAHAAEVMVWVKAGEKNISWPECVNKVRAIPGRDIYRLSVDEPASGCIQKLEQLDSILYVEEDHQIIISNSLVLSDSSSGDACDVTVNEVMVLNSLGKGDGIVAAVIDTGIALSMFASSLKKNSKEIPNDGIDNDFNGYVDDYDGWDFGDMDNDPQDLEGHGTQVSSILLSVAPDLLVLPLKVNEGMNTAFNAGDAAEAIFYAVDAGADIINMSFSTQSQSFAITFAIEYALDAGVIVAAAGGNTGGDVEFPASMDGVVAVGASDVSGAPSWFSPVGYALDLLGPGENVCATNVDGTTTKVSGTSFSTPFIAGAAGVLLSMNSHLQNKGSSKLLFKGCEDILDPGWDIYSGFGILNAQMLTDISTPAILIPEYFFQGADVTVDYYLPVTETKTDVFIAVIHDNMAWWIDAYGVWHSVDQDPYEKVFTKQINDFETKVLFGSSGLFPALDTGNSAPGTYQVVIGIFDADGNILAPLAWTETVILP